MNSEQKAEIEVIDCIAINTHQMVTLEAHESLIERLRHAWAERDRLKIMLEATQEQYRKEHAKLEAMHEREVLDKA